MYCIEQLNSQYTTFYDKRLIKPSTVKPCFTIDNKTTTYAMNNNTSRSAPADNDKAKATEMTPRKHPQVKTLIK